MGLSTGGLIAQHLALRHPELVRRLVLVVTGARIAEPGRQICQSWLDQVQRRDWRALRGTLTASAVDGRTAQRLARLLGGSGRQPDARDVADFEATVRADLRHDTSTVLPQMSVPTLILGGLDDPFFPEPVLRATAAAIPGAHVQVHAGGRARHQFGEERSSRPPDQRGHAASRVGGRVSCRRSARTVASKSRRLGIGLAPKPPYPPGVRWPGRRPPSRQGARRTPVPPLHLVHQD